MLNQSLFSEHRFKTTKKKRQNKSSDIKITNHKQTTHIPEMRGILRL